MADMYDNEGGNKQPMADSQDDGQGGGQQEGKTFLVNQEMYPNAKPGDQFMVKVEAIHDGEMSCSVMGEGEKEEGEEAPPDEGGEETSEAMPPGGGGSSMYD
jgi:hypothetical protein